MFKIQTEVQRPTGEWVKTEHDVRKGYSAKEEKILRWEDCENALKFGAILAYKKPVIVEVMD